MRALSIPQGASFGDIIVPTVDTARCAVVMESLLAEHHTAPAHTLRSSCLVNSRSPCDMMRVNDAPAVQPPLLGV
jgi:hypothetical protein